MIEKDPIEVALWEGALATVKSLWDGADYGYSRSAATYSSDGSGTFLEVTTDKHNSDGTNKVFTLEFKVTESVDHGDRHWAPDGYLLNGAKMDPLRVARIDGQHYYIETDTDGGFQGMGGRPFTIIFDDGREVTTRNLWSQGTIPPKWRELHPDNAHFKTAEYVTTADGGSAWNSDKDQKLAASALLQQSNEELGIDAEEVSEESTEHERAAFTVSLLEEGIRQYPQGCSEGRCEC